MIINQIILLKFIQTNNNVNWDEISINQKLSESFIKEFQDKIYWYNISEYQKLSENFIKKFKYKLYDK